MLKRLPSRHGSMMLLAAASAWLCAEPAAAQAGGTAATITNTAQVQWNEGGRNYSATSNTVAFGVAAQPMTMSTFVNQPGGNQTITYTPAQCGGRVIGSTATGSGTITTGATPGRSLHAGQTFFFSVSAPSANLSPNAIDQLTAVITTRSGDRETVTVFETGANTGIFVGAMSTAPVPPQPTPADCRLGVTEGDEISISLASGSAGGISANAILDVMADPYGMVFDSVDGRPIDGATVTMVDATTGAPANVFAPDGVSAWPSTVVTGQPVTAGNGQVFPILPGEFRFPLAVPGQYRFVVAPPGPYTVPSALSPPQLAGLTRPDGVPYLIADASYGGVFTLTSIEAVRMDIPADYPAVAVALTKTASRDRVRPGDMVFYTITATNPDTQHARRGVVLVDQSAPGLRLRRDSIRVDGAAANPAAMTISPDGQVLTLALGMIAPGATHKVTYAMTIREDASSGQLLNRVQATDVVGQKSFAGAVVTVEPDNLTGRMTLIGRVTAGSCDLRQERPGIPGIRVMLEDGSFAITDPDGRYHFDGLVPGDHVVAVAEQTLGEGGQFINCGRSTRNAGSATSRFVSGQGGSLAVADFYATLPHDSMAELVTVNTRNADDNIVKSPDSVTIPNVKVPQELDDSAKADRESAGADVDWLARGDGPAEFLFPAADHNPRAPALRIVIRHRPDQAVELLADGKPVSKFAFDGMRKSGNGAWAVSMWRGVPIEGEVVRLSATVRNADGTVANTLFRTVHFNGIAAEARLVPAQSKLIADGRTRPVVAVQLLDRSGRPVHAGVSGDLQLSAPYESAEAIEAMQARALTRLGGVTPHWTVRGDDGVALIELAPTLVSGPVQLDFQFVDGQQRRRQTINAWVVPGDQKWTLVGLAEGSVGARTVADAMERSGKFDSDLGQNARVAFYAKGRVLGRALLTVAYDSGKQRDDQRLLGTIDPRAYYTVFADGSDRRFDAASRNKLYVRLESKAFTALFGDFETGFSQTQLARYQRIATGVKAEARVGGFQAQGFAAKVASAHRRDEIQGGGITGPYPLSSRAIIASSETVEIETRDRFRSEVIVDRRKLSRFIDYDIDLLAGTITFKSPVMSRDFALNPQFIVIDYEIDTNSATGGALNAGGRVSYTSSDERVRIGATAISDTGSGARKGLVGVDVKGRIARGTELRAELAASRSGGIDQKAWLAEIEHHDGRLDVLAYARSMEGGFGLGQTNGVEAGRRKFGVDARYMLNDRFSVTGSGWIDDGLNDTTHREAVQLRGELRSGSNTFRAGASMMRDRLSSGRMATSTVLDASVSQRLFDNRLEIEAATSVGLGKTEAVDLPSRYQLALRYAVKPWAKLIGTYEIAKGEAVDARTGRVGVEITPWRGSRALSSLGQQDIAEFGKRSFAAFGLSQSLDLGRHLTVDASLDSNKVLSGIAPSQVINPLHPASSGGHLGQGGTIAEDFTALTLGGSWRANRWTVSARGEWREGEFADRKGLTFGAIRQLGEGSVLGSGATWTRANGVDGTASEIFDGAVALAHRPADSPLAVLAKLEFRSDRLMGGTGAAGPTAIDSTADGRASRIIGSVSFNLSPQGRDKKELVQRSEIGLFAAARYTFNRFQDQDLASTALLGGIDLHLSVGERIELGGTATVRANLADHATKFAFGPTIGISPARDVMLTVGYNLAGFRDRDFSAARFTEKGLFATLKAKFDTSTLQFLGLGR